MSTTLLYQSHSNTSKMAAEENTTAAALRSQILNLVTASQFKGKTNDEVSAFLGKTGSYFSPRFIELERDGLIIKLQETRQTRTGKQANVYVAKGYVGGRDIYQPKKKQIPDQWLIWSNEHSGWWKPHRCGYTPDINQAGVYTFEQALNICSDAARGFSGGFDFPKETMIAKESIYNV